MTLKFALFLCLAISFIFSCLSETTRVGTVNWWCTQTPHYEICNQYVVFRNPTMATISTNEFLDMTVEAAIDEARIVLKRAQGIESKYPNVPGKSQWGSCVDYFDGVVFTLNMIQNNTLQPDPLDVQTWLSASLAYINVCEKGFELIKKTDTMLPVISTNLTLLILNSLAISLLMKGSSTNITPGVVDSEYFLNEYKPRPDVVVAHDGSGDFKSVQEAVDSAMNRPHPGRYVIYVKAGIYEENVVIPRTVELITMFGDGINKTIISGSRRSGDAVLETVKVGDLKESATFQFVLYRWQKPGVVDL
ncbi:hypothetical protein Lser_V15G09239 [Lactuca serriola]